jgi:hypothetical protein
MLEAFDSLRGQHSQGWYRVGAWAVETLERELGQDWPQRAAAARRHEGRLEPLNLVAAHRDAYSWLVELAIHFEELQGVDGLAKLRRALTRDPRPQQLAHASILLEVASLAISQELAVGLEVQRDGRPPVDVAVEGAAGELLVEARAILTSDKWRDQSASTDRLFEEIHNLEFRYDVNCEGSILEQIDEADIADLLASAEIGARVAAVGLVSPVVRSSGARLRFLPAGKQGVGLTGPQMVEDPWRHVMSRIRQKAEQAAASGATWLRLDVLNGLWQFTRWGQLELGEKLDLVGTELGKVDDRLQGIILSSGALQAQAVFLDEDYASSEGTALRRVLPLGRVRELLIVAPLGHQREVWTQVYAAEGDWLDTALKRCRLPSAHELFPPA